MKLAKKTGRKMFAILLLVILCVPHIAAVPAKADAASNEEAQTQDESSISEKAKREILQKNHLADTEDSVKGKNNGRNPLTGSNEVTACVNPSYELLVGDTEALNASERTQRVTQTIYDLEGKSTFTQSNGTVQRDENETTNTSRGEIVTAVRTTAFDPLGEGKDAYVAELTALHAESVAFEELEKGIDYNVTAGTVIYLTVYDARGKGGETRTIPVGYLRYDIEEWQADAYMQVSAGDFDGDGKDELAVYCPTDTTKTSNDMTLLNTSSYVTLYSVEQYGSGEDSSIDIEEMLTEDTRYYINVSDRDSDHTLKNKDTFKNSVDELCAVDLETIRHPSGTKDSLAIAVCPPRNGTKITSSFEAETRVDIWLDAAKAPSASNLSKHSMRWDLSNYQSNKWKAGKEYDVMYYGGLSAGDLDNDGTDELVVAGYRLRNTANAKKWKLDDRYLFIERLIPYDNGQEDFGYKSSGNVPQMINAKGKGNLANTCVGNYGSEDNPTSIDRKIFSPLTVECYRAKGKDFADVVFLAGQVYEWKDTYPANYVRKETLQAKSEGGYKKIAFTQIKGIDGSDSVTKNHLKVIANCSVSGHLAYSSAVSGNFDNNPYGMEQLYAVYHYISGGTTGSSILEIKQKEVGEYDLTTTASLTLKKLVERGNCVGISLCAPDVDDDSTRVTYASQELYYANPQPVAILQAPPYFSDIAENDSDYLSTGNTSFTTGSGTGASRSNSFTVTAGIIVGMEQSISLLGLFKTGLSAMTEVSGGAGYENQVETTKTFTTTYNATKEDQVIAVAIPYIRYRYDVQNPTMKTLTAAQLKQLSSKLTQLKTSAASSSKSKEEKEKLTKAWIVLNEYYNNQKELIDEYDYGKTLKNETVQMTYAQPGTPDTATLSKDKYNAMVKSMGLEDLVITDDVLHGATPGDVASYIWKSSGNDSGYTWSGDFSSIGEGASGTSVTQSITEEKTTQKSVTWNAGLHNEATATIGGITAGLSSTLEYSGAKADIDMSTITAQGTVARIPDVDDGKAISQPDVTDVEDIAIRDNYAFKFRVGTWLTKLGQNECRVVGYQVETAVPGQKFPTKPVQDMEVERIDDSDGNYKSVKVKWSTPKCDNPAYYSTPTGYKVWKIGSDVTKRAIYAQNNKTSYEMEYDSGSVKENTAFAAAVRPIELSDDYACISNPIYIMNQGLRDAIFTEQPKDITYRAVDANKSGKAEFSSVVKMNGTNLTFDYSPEKVKWQFFDPATKTWKQMFKKDQTLKKNVAVKELEEYGITSAEDSLTSFSDVKNTPGTATLEIAYDKIPEELKFRVSVAYSVDGTSGVFYATSEEAGFSLETTSIEDAKMEASGDGLSVSASTKNVQNGSIVAAKLKNLTNNASSSDILIYPNNVVNLQSAAPGVYQLETEETVSNQGSVVSNRIPYYAKEEKLLAIVASKKKVVRSARKLRGVSTVQADVNDMTYGEELLLTSEYYDKNAAEPDVPQTANDVKFSVRSNAQDQDVTEECIQGNIFRPNSAGEFVITATMEAGEDTITSTKIVNVAAKRERYDKEVFDKVVTAQLPELQGVVYGAEKNAEALGLPETTAIQTISGIVCDAMIDWDVKNCDYDPSSAKAQTFDVKGVVVLPDDISKEETASTDVKISVTVNESKLEVQMPEDNMPPVDSLKGNITVGGENYSDLKETIAFDTELTGPQKVEITASDEEDENIAISYLKSTAALTKEELENADNWNTGTELTLTEGERCVIYAKLQNSAGDVIYLSTDGIVVKKKTSTTEENRTTAATSTTAADSTTVATSTTAAENTTTTERTNDQTDAAQKGKTYTVKKITYQVVSVGRERTVEVTGTVHKGIKTLTIPATITIRGQQYKVTAIKKAAFKNKKKLTKVVIGKNVTKIGNNAFSGCKKLKKVVIKSTQWRKQTLGKKAFYKIAAKPEFKIPAKKLKAYKKLLKQSKVSKKAKFKK